MEKLRLNTGNIEKLKPKDNRYEVVDTDIPGFRLRISPDRIKENGIVVSGTKTFSIMYRTKAGKRVRYTIGTYGQITAKQAREIAQLRFAEVELGKDPHEEKRQTRQDAEREQANTLGGFLDQRYGPWVLEHRKDGKATLARINTIFSEFRSRKLIDIDSWIIQKWRMQRLKSGIMPSTANRDLVALKAALSQAVEWKLIDQHPLKDVKPLELEDDGRVRYLDDNEEKRLRAAIDEREYRLRQQRTSANVWRQERDRELLPDISKTSFADHLKPMVLLSLNTGVRRGELMQLTWHNVDLTRDFITVIARTAKSKRTRHIPLNQEARASLVGWRSQNESDDLVFPGKQGQVMRDVDTSWRSVLKAANIKNFHWHDQRHHFASKLVMAGVDLNTVRELMGHKDITMTLRYAHLAPEHKAQAVARLVNTGI